MKKQLTNIIDGILAGVQKETLQKYPDLIKALSEYKDADDFHMSFQYPIENVIQATLMARYPEADRKKIHKLCFIYEEYRYAENFFNQFIKKWEGLACSSDKSGYIMREFERLYGKNKPINIERKEGNEYWMPTCLTVEQWEQFFDAIYDLWWGSPVKYLSFVKDIEIPMSQKQQKTT